MVRILDEIEIVGVWERGVPNRERIALKVREQIDLAEYLLIFGVPIAEQLVLPYTNWIFYFGKEIVPSPYWIIVYTGPGEKKLSQMKDSGEPALVLHCGHKTTILHEENIVPVMVSVDGILVGPHTKKLSLVDARKDKE